MFGKRLKELREDNGYSMDKLIEIYNKAYGGKMNKSTLSRYENGLQEPMYTVVVNLAKIFNVSVDYMTCASQTPTEQTSNTVAEDAKRIFAKKLNFYMNKRGVSQADIASAFNITASTVSDWCNGKKYPQGDKIQLLADYLHIAKSDLVEEKPVDNNIVIYSRNGETIRKKLSKEQMDYLDKFINSFGEEDYPDL